MTEYALIGYPLIHSFSQQYFTEKFEHENIRARYLNMEMQSVDGLMDFIEAHPQLKGLNVTIPHKQAVMPLLHGVSDETLAIGAVNCIKIERQPLTLTGYNTDVIGFERSIQPLLQPHHKKALVLGTGGASKAVVYGLKRLGVEPVLVSRTPADGMLGYDQLSHGVMDEYTVIVNCTPLGTFPSMDTCPDIPYKYIGGNHLLYDLVYNPAETLFLQRGKQRGATTKNGLEMLHLQAEAAWQIWTQS
ncbi:MAG: shikimate dehydrogenase [Bacteroidaceae bacterium]|nr:shikimate dehydrogenase [Bacteroidaceae bacterium]